MRSLTGRENPKHSAPPLIRFHDRETIVIELSNRNDRTCNTHTHTIADGKDPRAPTIVSDVFNDWQFLVFVSTFVYCEYAFALYANLCN